MASLAANHARLRSATTRREKAARSWITVESSERSAQTSSSKQKFPIKLNSAFILLEFRKLETRSERGSIVVVFVVPVCMFDSECRAAASHAERPGSLGDALTIRCRSGLVESNRTFLGGKKKRAVNRAFSDSCGIPHGTMETAGVPES